MVNLARKAGVQPGPALDAANRKFRDRFEAVERLAGERGIDMESAGLEVLDGLWEEVKKARARAKANGERSGKRVVVCRSSPFAPSFRLPPTDTADVSVSEMLSLP